VQWPNELLALLEQGMSVQPVAGLSPRHVYRELLDETARRAVWRARGNPEWLGAALRTPYTPLGSVTADLVNGLARRLCLTGPQWGNAVEAIHHFMEQHAADVCASFREEARPYDSDVGFDSLLAGGKPSREG
jgi:hypothetical protein